MFFRKSLHSEFQISSHSTHSIRSTRSALSAPLFASQALDIFSKVVANCSAVIGIWRPEFSPPTGLDNHRKTTRKTMTMTTVIPWWLWLSNKKRICHPVVLVRLVLLGCCSPCLQRHTNLWVEPKATGSSSYLQRLHDKGTEQVTEAKPATRETMQTARHDTNDMWLMWLMWLNMCHTEMKSLWMSRCRDAAGESHTGFPLGAGLRFEGCRKRGMSECQSSEFSSAHLWKGLCKLL